MADPDVKLNYSYSDKVRDVSAALILVLVAQPTFISLVKPAPYQARSHKFEWEEQALQPESTTLSAGIDDDDTVLPVVSKTPFTVNSIIRFEGTDEVARVTAVAADPTMEVTIVRGYGGTTAAAVVSGKKVTVISKPKNEGSVPQYGKDATQPDLYYNYTEIFDGEVVVSNSKERIYGISENSTDPVGDLLNYKMKLEMTRISRRMNAALIFGRRSERTSTVPGTMGGILQYAAMGNVLTPAGTPRISRKILGDAFQKCFDGGATKLDTILCGAIQARNISSLYANKLMIVREDTTLGQRILRVQPDMPIEGYVSTIVVDPSFPDDKVEICNSEDIKLVPQRPMTDKDSTPNGADFVSRRMIGEYTAEFNSIGKTGCLINGLSTAVYDPDA